MNITPYRQGHDRRRAALVAVILSTGLSGCWRQADANDFPGVYTSNTELGSSIELRGDGSFTEWRNGKAGSGSWAAVEGEGCPNIDFQRLGGSPGGLFDPERHTCLKRGWGEYRITIDDDLGHYYSRKR